VSDLLFPLPEKEPGLRFPGETEYISLDFETTGLYPAYHRIIEIGAVRFTLKGETDRFQSLVNPDEPIALESTAIHGITDEMVKHAEKIEILLPRLLSYIGDRVIVGHNVGFDMAFLDAACAAAGAEALGNIRIDTRNLARKTFPGLHSYSLEKLKESLALPANESHRALDDALTAMELFLRAVVRVPGWERKTMRDFSAYTR